MKALLTKLNLIALCTVTMLAFQNCSESKFASIPDASANNGLDNGDGVTLPEDDEDGDDSDYVDEDTGDMDTDIDYDATAKCAKFKAAAPAIVAGENVSTNTRGKREFPGSFVSVTNHRGRASIPNALDVVTADTRGRLFIRTASGDSITNSRGSLCVVDNGEAAPTGDGVINSIENHRGRIEVDGLDVDTISNTRGPIVLRNVHVNSITNHRGSIRLINSTVDSITDHRGRVRYK